MDPSGDPVNPRKLLLVSDGTEGFADELTRLQQAQPTRLAADAGNAERGLAQLVLALVDLLRQLLERQALRRVEGGTLTDEEVERLGLTFMALEQRMAELTEAFGLTPEDLSIVLGTVRDA